MHKTWHLFSQEWQSVWCSSRAQRIVFRLPPYDTSCVVHCNKAKFRVHCRTLRVEFANKGWWLYKIIYIDGAVYAIILLCDVTVCWDVFLQYIHRHVFCVFPSYVNRMVEMPYTVLLTVATLNWSSTSFQYLVRRSLLWAMAVTHVLPWPLNNRRKTLWSTFSRRADFSGRIDSRWALYPLSTQCAPGVTCMLLPRQTPT